MIELFLVTPLDWVGLAAAFFSGTMVGFERQISGKPAGMRTSALICIGTYIFVTVGNAFGMESARIIGQVVTGVGFLGGGVIISKEGVVQGMTSAAAIWILAAIGVVIGVGYPVAGVKIAVVTIAILVGIDWLERTFKILQHGVHKHIIKKGPDHDVETGPG